VSDNQPVKIDFGMPLAVLGTLTCLVVWGFSHNRRLAALERRLENLGTGMADLATRQTMTELNSNEAVADLAALRQAILAAMGRTNFVGRGLTIMTGKSKGTNYLPRWQTDGTLTNNAYASPKP